MKIKSFQLGLTGMLSLAAVFSFSCIGFSQQLNDSEEIEKLKEQINKLELKVNEQSETISNLQKEISELKSRRPLLAIPKLGEKNSLPKGSQEFRFNGQTYYIVPLDNRIKLMNIKPQKEQ